MVEFVSLQIGHEEDYMTVDGIEPHGQNEVNILMCTQSATPLLEQHTLRVRVDKPDVLVSLYKWPLQGEPVELVPPSAQIDYEFGDPANQGGAQYFARIHALVPQKVMTTVFVDDAEADAQSVVANVYDAVGLSELEYNLSCTLSKALYFNYDGPPEFRYIGYYFAIFNVGNPESKTGSVKAIIEGDGFEFVDSNYNPVGTEVEFEAQSGVESELVFHFNVLGNARLRFQVEGFEEISSACRIMDMQYSPPLPLVAHRMSVVRGIKERIARALV